MIYDAFFYISYVHCPTFLQYKSAKLVIVYNVSYLFCTDQFIMIKKYKQPKNKSHFNSKKHINHFLPRNQWVPCPCLTYEIELLYYCLCINETPITNSGDVFNIHLYAQGQNIMFVAMLIIFVEIIPSDTALRVLLSSFQLS